MGSRALPVRGPILFLALVARAAMRTTRILAAWAICVADQPIQFSTFRPRTRWNSPMLAVMSVASIE